MQPNRFRPFTEIITPKGRNLGQSVAGFDGRIGWNSSFGSCYLLRGQEYKLRRDASAFFGCYVEPGNYETAECLGEARFDGKLCYDDLKVVTQTQHERFHYYDATNFLLVGICSRVKTSGVVSWNKVSYSDYRAIGGFLMPLRVVSRCDWGDFPLQLSSMEINTVTLTTYR